MTIQRLFVTELRSVRFGKSQLNGWMEEFCDKQTFSKSDKWQFSDCLSPNYDQSDFGKVSWMAEWRDSAINRLFPNLINDNSVKNSRQLIIQNVRMYHPRRVKNITCDHLRLFYLYVILLWHNNCIKHVLRPIHTVRFFLMRLRFVTSHGMGCMEVNDTVHTVRLRFN